MNHPVQDTNIYTESSAWYRLRGEKEYSVFSYMRQDCRHCCIFIINNVILCQHTFSCYLAPNILIDIAGVCLETAQPVTTKRDVGVISASTLEAAQTHDWLHDIPESIIRWFTQD